MRRAMGLAAAAFAALALWSGNAPASTTFHPRVGGALGLVPSYANADIATGAPTAVDYNGGAVMAANVTVHTIFWAPSGYSFTAGYEALVKQFLTDAAAASGTTSNVFSVLREYGQQTGTATAVPGNYSIAYDATSDSIDDVNPYPSSGGCASPSGVPTCLTDGQVQAEIDAVAPADERGLGNLWFVLLPPNVDECITAGSCGTNSFAGYHEAMDRAGGVTIYGVIIDPIVEFVAPPGADPAGQSRRRGDDRHHRPRDRRGDHRSRGHRLGGPQRLRGRRQVRGGPADREPARLRRERLALRPAHRRPRVPDPGDVVQRRRRLRAAHDPDRHRRCRSRRST